MKRRVGLIGFFLLACALSGTYHPLSAQAPEAASFFKNRSDRELAALDRGEAIISPVVDWKSLSLGAQGAVADSIRSRIASIKPNYITEVLASAPAADTSAAGAILARLAAALADVQGYVGIPYFSKSHQKTFDLFDKMAVSGRSAIPGGESISVTQHMEPFDDFAARYEYCLSGPGGIPPAAGAAGALFFIGTNTGPIIYTNLHLEAVRPESMVWALYARGEGRRVHFYAVGAVHAFDLFGAFRDRLAVSLTGRTEAFFIAMKEKMEPLH